MALKLREFTGKQHGPHLLITGGVHGDEFVPMAAIRRLIRLFDDHQYDDHVRGRITLVPVVSEAAFRRGQRVAEDGLDLARACPGRPDGTVTERTAFALSRLIRSADFYIDLHSGGTEFSVFPLTGYTLHADPGIRDKQRRMARAFNLPIVWGTAGNLDGRSLSIARDANVPAIYAEFLGSAVSDPHGVDAYADGCLNVMAELEMIHRPAPPSKVKHIVEDPRPGSGHMQVCNPSPMAGYFEPAVRLGGEIRIGDPIGTVCDPLGERMQTICSEQDGIVLVLRVFPRILEGESAGVVLETGRFGGEGLPQGEGK